MKNLFSIILSYLLISFNTYVFSNENNNENHLKIGVLAPFSGEFKDLGQSVLYSVNLALHDIDDKLIKVYPKDSGSTKEKIIVAANEYDVSLWDVVSNPESYPISVNKPTQERLNNFVNKIKSFQAQANQMNAFELGETIAKESGIIRELKNEIDKGPEEIERFQKR